MLADAGIKATTVIPETVLRTLQITDTVLLIQCLDGVEGQIWQNNLLVGSRWWAQIPEPKEWINFQRIYSLQVIDSVPMV